MPSGQKLTLGLLATITLDVVPFQVYAPFSALLPFFFLNASWKSRSVRVFRKVGWVGDDSHVVFGQNIPG
jgi:hypothetical protein